MSGKPRFNEASVIDAAMRVFWRHGYPAASIDQLTTAMGISRSSLYKRFGDKEGLFREVLSAYTERVLRRMNLVQAPTKREQLKSLLFEFHPKQASRPRPPGCMLVRSCAEMADLPPSGRIVALNGLARQRAVFSTILREAAESGELPQEADVDALAWHYLGVLQAIVTLPQAGAKADELRRMVDLAMLAWPSAKP